MNRLRLSAIVEGAVMWLFTRVAKPQAGHAS
jgi:hypothetical protein